MKGPYKSATPLHSRPCSACSIDSLLILTPRTRLRLNLKVKGLVPVSGVQEASPTVPRLRLKRPVTRFSLYLQRRSFTGGMYRRDALTARPSLSRQSTSRGRNLGETERRASVGQVRRHSSQFSPTRVPGPRVRVAGNCFSSSGTPAPWTPVND